MARKRKQYTGEEKLAILRKHLLEGVAVSDICDEHELQPAVPYPQSGGTNHSRPSVFAPQRLCHCRVCNVLRKGL